MIVMPVFNGCAAFAPTRYSRTLDLEPSQPMMMFPRSVDPSSNVAVTFDPVEMTDTSFLPNFFAIVNPGGSTFEYSSSSPRF